MTIWIDLCHTPQYNYYRKLILQLSAAGHTVLVTILKRGRTPQIVMRELEGVPGVQCFVVGKHAMRKWSVLLQANLLRLFQLGIWSFGKKIDLCLSNGMVACIVSKLSGIHCYAFDDDPQTIDFKPKRWAAIESNYCLYEASSDVIETGRGVQVLKVLKEWAYLAPKYFRADVTALDEYGVKPKEYIFLREVTVGTFNYAEQQAGAVKGLCRQIEQLRETARQQGKEMKVLFSLEEKHRRDEYPADWILLQEPINDIHSLIYYSVGLISSGDSMAREAALLGVPSYYLGVRFGMPANLAASKVAGLQNQKTMPVEQWLNDLTLPAEALEQKQEALRQKIDAEFIDINEYMMDLVRKHDKK